MKKMRVRKVFFLRVHFFSLTKIATAHIRASVCMVLHKRGENKMSAKMFVFSGSVQGGPHTETFVASDGHQYRCRANFPTLGNIEQCFKKEKASECRDRYRGACVRVFFR